MSEYMNKEVFEQDVRGFLFFNETTFDGSERWKIIFEYNPQTLYKLREGDIVAVESFSTLAPHENGTFYTLLEILKLNPTHITIDRLKKYRFMGAVREFLKESTKDFEEEDSQLIRDHVYVEADAAVTGYLMKVTREKEDEGQKANVKFIEEPSKPILGRDVGVLKANVLEKLINRNIRDGITVGELFSNFEEKQIPVLVRPHRMITHHYSIFGFTGSGKSNLNSMMITRLLEKRNLKVVVFDLSDEYTALMIDKILSSGIVLVDENDVPESVVEYLRAKQENEKTGDQLEKASRELAETLKKPGVYDSTEFVPVYEKAFKELLKGGRIRILKYLPSEEVAAILTLQDFFDELDARATSSWDKRNCQNMKDLLRKFCEEEGIPWKENYSEWKIEEFDDFSKFIMGLCGRVQVSKGFYPTIEALLEKIRRIKEAVEKAKTKEIEEEGYITDPNWIIKSFIEDTEGDYNLCILVSSEKEKLILILNTIITVSLEIRRRGTKKHSVLFVVDEGHEFLMNPRESGLSEGERTSSRVLERLTRMGRKYGLGVCIASQRVAHLNTTAISNCHTTFIGALPRKYDRDTMNEAYAVSQDVLNQVVTFPPGNWYLLSMIATGIKNVPIRIVASNREKELAEFFKNNGLLSKKQKDVLKEYGYIS